MLALASRGILPHVADSAKRVGVQSVKGPNESRIETLWGPWMWLMLAISSVAMVWPLWVSDLLPFQDLPQHLAAVRTIHSLDDPAWLLSKYHVVDLSRTQYLSWYLILDWMTTVMPLDVACRVLLSLYVISVPLSCYALLRALHLDPTAALLAAPLAFNTYLYMGFANYVSALPIVLLALALLVRSFGRWSLAEAFGLACLSVVLFYSHVQALLMYIGFAGLTLLLLAPSWRPRSWLRQMAHHVPTLGLLGLWMSRSRILATGKAWAQGHGGRNTTEAKFHFEPVMDRFKAIPGQLIEAFPDDSDDHLLLVWVAALCLIALLSVRGDLNDDAPRQGAQPPRNFRAMLRERIGAVWLVAGFGVYLVSPLSYKWIWPISHRLIPLLALVAVVAVAGRRS